MFATICPASQEAASLIMDIAAGNQAAIVTKAIAIGTPLFTGAALVIAGAMMRTYDGR